MAATKTPAPKKKTIDDVFAQITDISKNLQQELDGLQQNVNTVGEVAAGNSPAVSAGSATNTIKQGLGDGGMDPQTILLLIAAGVGLYYVTKNH